MSSADSCTVVLLLPLSSRQPIIRVGLVGGGAAAGGGGVVMTEDEEKVFCEEISMLLTTCALQDQGKIFNVR